MMVEIREKDRLAEAITENVVKILKVDGERKLYLCMQRLPMEIGSLRVYVPKSTTLCVKTKVNLMERRVKLKTSNTLYIMTLQILLTVP